MELFIFSLPIIFGNLGQTFIGTTEIYIAGQYSTNVLASVGIAQGLTGPFLMVGFGLLLGLSPLLAIKRGHQKKPDHLVTSCLVYGLIVGIIIVPLLQLSLFLVPYIGFDKELIVPIQKYTFYFSFSLIPAFLYQGLREYLQAMEKVFVANLLSFLSAFLNLGLGLLFVFGKGPFPEMGILGLALSLNIIRFLTFIGLLIPCFPLLKRHFIVDWAFLKEAIYLSFPLAITVLLEICAFCLVTVLTGIMGKVESAAHNIVLSVASITFMIPLGISNALCVKVAKAFGEKSLQQIKSYSWVGLFMATGVMGLSGVVLFFFAENIFSIFSKDKTLFVLASNIFMVAAFFQLADGLQVALNGILRGLKMTKECMFVTIISHWFIGLPLGYFLGFTLKMGPIGLWIGLGTSLWMAGILLFILFFKKIKNLRFDEREDPTKSYPIVLGHNPH